MVNCLIGGCMSKHKSRVCYKFEREEFRVGLEMPIPFEELVRLGQYNFAEPRIVTQELLKTTPVRVPKVTLVWLVGPVPEARYIPGLLKPKRLRVATLYELAAFGWKYPDEQRKFTIHAFGDIDKSEINLTDYSKARGGRAYGAALSQDVEGRCLTFSSFFSAIQLALHPAMERYPATDRYAAVEITGAKKVA